MLFDLRAVCRDLLKKPAFSCITVLTLSLGIGATTAIFAVVNRVMLSPLPYPDSERLVYVGLGPVNEQLGFRLPPSRVVASAWRDAARTLEGIAGYTRRDVVAYDENGARVLRGMGITPGLPVFLGVTPLLGRDFSPADAGSGATAVAMLSYALWQRDYGGERDVIGRAVTLDGTPHIVIGVMPPGWDAFAADPRPEVWLPESLDPGAPAREALGLELLARLRPDVTPEAAVAELNGILAEFPPQTFGGQPLTVRLDRPVDRLAGRARDALGVLFGAVGVMLLLACSNAANLLLARGAARMRELAVRTALGAGRWRLVRLQLTECLVLALASCATGVGVGWLLMRVMIPLRPQGLEALDDLQFDMTVLAFAVGVALATAVLLGIAPALQLGSRSLGKELRNGATGVARGGVGPRMRKLFVAAQMALSVVLLVSAGLLVRSFVHLQQIDVGFDADNLFTAELRLPRGRYQEAAARSLLSDQLLDRVRSSPGVAAATQATVGLSIRRMFFGNLEIRGTPFSEADAEGPYGGNDVRPDYFRTLGIPLLQGRTFTVEESRAGRAVIVNETAAEQFWPAGGAIGAEIRFSEGSDWSTVVGVVGNTISGGLTESRDAPLFFFPLTAEAMLLGAGDVLLIVRAAEDPAVAIASVRAAVHDVDPEIAIDNVTLVETAFAGSTGTPRFSMAVMSAFALVGLVLAVVGLAAVTGYEVIERTHEIGIRIALGARTENVRRLAMMHGLIPALIGVAIGAIGAYGASRVLASTLYGVAPRDPLTFLAVVVLLVFVALCASWLAARRGTGVQPIVALQAS